MFHVADIRAFIHFRSRDLGNMKYEAREITAY